MSLKEYEGKFLIVMNTASSCGHTDANYRELVKLYDTYREQGLEILAFPCNQFMGQEGGSIEQIWFPFSPHASEFAKKRKANWKVFDKIDVNGKSESPLFTFLKAEDAHLTGSKANL